MVKWLSQTVLGSHLFVSCGVGDVCMTTYGAGSVHAISCGCNTHCLLYPEQLLMLTQLMESSAAITVQPLPVTAATVVATRNSTVAQHFAMFLDCY